MWLLVVLVSFQTNIYISKSIIVSDLFSLNAPFPGGVNGVVFTSARLFATGAQDGHLPSFFSLVHHKQQTPIPSLIFSVSVSVEGFKI